jgi:hypothetical protein
MWRVAWAMLAHPASLSRLMAVFLAVAITHGAAPPTSPPAYATTPATPAALLGLT